MKILVTGANGAVASSVVPQLINEKHQVLATDIICPNTNPFKIVKMDIRDRDEIERVFTEFKPDIVVHLAAEVDLEKCELDPEHAVSTNAQGTKNIALECKKSDSLLIYTSSVGVFDGRKTSPYNEQDIPGPINLYGKTKYQGELYVQEILIKYYIVRFGWMMGGGRKDKKFVAKIVRLLNDGKRKLDVVNDKRGTPVYTQDLARVLIELINKRNYGIYHLACFGSANRYEIARKIVALLGRKDVTIAPVSTKKVENIYFAPRPENESVDNSKVNKLIPGILKDWEESLKSYYEETKSFKNI